MLYVHLLLLLFLLFFSSTSVTRRGMLVQGNPLRIVTWLYLLSAVASIFYFYNESQNFDLASNERVYLALYTLLIFLVLSPVLILRGYKLPEFSICQHRQILLFYRVSSIFIWFAMAYQLPFAATAIATGALEVRTSASTEAVGILPQSVLTTAAVGVSSFYVVFSLMLFIAIKEKLSLYLRVSMFAGTALYLVSSICFAARDGALFCVLTFVFSYGIFKHQLDATARKNASRLIWLIVITCSLAIGSFTIQRFFNYGDQSSLFEGTVGYIGQQPHVFAETIAEQNFFYGLHLRAPLLSMLLGQTPEDIERTVRYEWSFGTFLKDYYAMFGWQSLFFLSLLTALVPAIIFSRRNRYHPACFLIAMAFYFQFMTSGLFYLKLGSWAGNQYSIILVLLAYFANRYLKRKQMLAHASDAGLRLGSN